jgi:hypothetical protein
VARESEVYIMSTINISRGGVFIQGDPADCPDVKAGVKVELVIFPSEDLGLPDVHLQATVVRVVRVSASGTPQGFGLQFQSLQPQEAAALEKLLQAAIGR